MGIVLGQALTAALGKKEGIRRYGTAHVPMDETLARVAIDLSGRPYPELRGLNQRGKVGNFPAQLVEEFLRALSVRRSAKTVGLLARLERLDAHADSVETRLK